MFSYFSTILTLPNLVNGYISVQEPKAKSTLLSHTFKSKENKEPSAFSILPEGLRYSHVLIFCQPFQIYDIVEFRKWRYLSS